MDLLVVMSAFVLAVVLISASPGPAMALIVQRATPGGWRRAVPTVLGIELGLYVWALAAAAGFAALVAVSEAAFVTLKLIGVGVLFFLGLRALRAARRGRPVEQAGAPESAGRGRQFAEGFVVQLANPKAAVFMLAFYPQFVPAGRPLFATTAALALLQVTIETALYLALAAGVGRASGFIDRPGIRRRLDAALGTVLVALGVRLALTSR